jgi:hypothetical protein
MKKIEKSAPRAQPNRPQPPRHDPDRHFEEDEPETVRSSSQTAQDRDHTIRGGDNQTGPMKEFPT